MITPGMDLSHTPGIYYAIAYWLGSTFFIWHNPKRLTGWKLGVAHVAFFLAIAALWWPRTVCPGNGFCRVCPFMCF